MAAKVGRRRRLYVVVAQGIGRPYISGAFARLQHARAYLQEIPESTRSRHKVTKLRQRFPLFVLEDDRGFRFFDLGAIVEAVSAYRDDADPADEDFQHAVLYCLSEGYRPVVPGADEMGRMLHRHVTNESLHYDVAWLMSYVHSCEIKTKKDDLVNIDEGVNWTIEYRTAKLKKMGWKGTFSEWRQAMKLLHADPLKLDPPADTLEEARKRVVRE